VFGSGERRLHFPTATIGIRGTACYVDSQLGRDYFCLCHGEAELIPLAAPAHRRPLRTRHHDEPYTSPPMNASRCGRRRSSATAMPSFCCSKASLAVCHPLPANCVTDSPD